MLKYLLSLYSFIFYFGLCHAQLPQNKLFPSNYFESPLDIPLFLSGTFGELRPNHFHAGFDIRTQQKEGFKVYAAAEGYISRIRISHWGYGKVVYITHPNGFTTVYAHLQRFSDRLETYIKKKQYENESFEMQVYPNANELPISRKEVIGLSGRTGGFMGPHLHFEIRDSSTQNAFNPMLFGFNLNDSIKPTIDNVIGYTKNNDSHINQLSIPTQLSLKKSTTNEIVADSIKAYGEISFGVHSFDVLDGAPNRNGIYSLEMLVNGQKIHEFNTSQFAFKDDKLINLLVDYKRLAIQNQTIQKCFVEPLNSLGMYATNINNGYLKVEDGIHYKVEIIAKDFKGNQQKVSIPIKGKKDSILVTSTPKITNYSINHTQFNKFELNGVKVSFPKYTFYNDLYLDFVVENNRATIHTPTVPVAANFTLTFDTSTYSQKEKEQLYIAYLTNKNRSSYTKTIKKDNYCYTSTRKFGNYAILFDDKIPTIKLYNFKENQWLTNHLQLKVKIGDIGSGIKSYRGEIDGAWILMEYDVTNGILTHDFTEKTYMEAKHELKIVVMDNVGNTSELVTTFYRK
ncbi:M23 family metallopeptidase [Lutibacter sp.]|uniref:M23 family metallopeptidase n=1 Tax=Lutibacter sp. TaxID=1925666 RepID=UPI002733C579|nr:M23 family metallopeptidase [Lutibacter sp.]MDP3311882.1 M23 family metallopeptidase [Lutibacter sp.]